MAADDVAPGAVQDVRRFNRTVAQRIGALDDEYLAHDRPLGASRVLWEVGPAGSDVRQLRARLGLDSGYLSRLLRGLQRDGLLTVTPDPGDRRARTVALTPAGLAEHRVLDSSSDDLARSLLEPLTGPQQHRLVAAMDTVERLLRAGTVEVVVEDPTSDAARTCLAAYLAELDHRFDAGVDPDRMLAVEAADLTEPAGLLLVARQHGEPVGCGGVKLPAAAPAEIKRLWVAPAARGLGLGRRILDTLEDRARARGHRSARLDTNRSLHEAIALYRSTGYVEVPRFNDEPYAHHWFEKVLDQGTAGG